jgi:serine/threonine protein phosphatase 1
MKNKINPGDILSCGDVHARADLLELLLEEVAGTQAVLIFLGDLIDRGGQDIQVVERIRKLTEDPESEGLSGCFALKGNHEDMFVKAITGTGDDWGTWLHNGGNFEQFGELQEHLEWFDELPIYMTIGETLFVHGGLVPGRDPYELVESGREGTLIWMREPFLSRGPEFEKWNPGLKQVVFGHTPKFDEGEGLPYTIPDGICIDTGAYFTGVLTAYNVSQNQFYQFTGEPLEV